MIIDITPLEASIIKWLVFMAIIDRQIQLPEDVTPEIELNTKNLLKKIEEAEAHEVS